MRLVHAGLRYKQHSFPLLPEVSPPYSCGIFSTTNSAGNKHRGTLRQARQQVRRTQTLVGQASLRGYLLEGSGAADRQGPGPHWQWQTGFD